MREDQTHPAGRVPNESKRLAGEAFASGGRADRRRTWGLLAALVTVAGVGISILVAAMQWQSLRRNDRMHLESISQRVASEMTKRFETYRAGLTACHALYAASEMVRPDEFREMVKAMDLSRNYPGAVGMGFITLAEARGGGELVVEQVVRPDWSESESGSRSRSGSGSGSGSGGDLRDVRNDPAVRKAAQMSATHQEPVLSDPVILTQGDRPRQGLLYFTPVLSRSDAANTGERKGPITAWVAMWLASDGVMNGIERAVGGEVSFTVAGMGTEAAPVRIYQSENWNDGDAVVGANSTAVTADRVVPGNMAVEIPVAFGSVSWRIHAQPSGTFRGSGYGVVVGVLIGGIALSVLLGLFVTVQDRAIRQSARWAQEATANSRRLAVFAERTTSVVVMTDVNRRIVWVNDGFVRLTGYSVEEAMGRSPGALLQCERTDPETVLRIRRCLANGEGFRGDILNRSKSGVEYWLDLNIEPLHDEQGKLTGFMAIESDVTEARHQSELVSELADRLEAATAGTSDGLWDWAVESNVVWRSRQFWALLGYAPDMETPRENFEAWAGLLHPGDSAKTLAALSHTAESGAKFDIEYRLKHLSGEYRWFRARAETTKGAGGKVVRVAGSIQDIHPQKQAVAERDRLFDLSLDPMGIAGFDGIFKQINSAWSRTLGWSKEELTSKPFIEFVHTDDREATKLATEGLARGEPTFGFENRYRCVDGSYRWLSWNACSLTDEGVIFAVARDVTEQKRLLAEVLRAAEITAAANSAMEEAQAVGRLGSWTYDLRSGVVIWSKHLYVLFGRDPYAGTPTYSEILDDYSDEAGLELDAAVKRAATDGTPYRLTLRTRRGPNGVRYIRGDGRARKDGAGEVVELYGTATDVTSEVEREEALKLARQAAETANRSKSEFLANMSHEIRTPMTAILGYADLLAEDGESNANPAARIEYIRTIKRNGDHLLSIINDILDISKIEAGKMEIERVETDPWQIVGEVVSLMQVKAQAKGISLKFDCAGPIPRTMLSDPLRLRQILVNLVGNAVKFTEMGGVSIGVSFSRGGVEGESDGSLRLDIQDTGIGMSESALTRLFSAFQQSDSSTTRKFGGTGLGLMISQRLASMLGGNITVTSEPGKGSTFSLLLSIKREPGDTGKTSLFDPRAATSPEVDSGSTGTPSTPGRDGGKGRVLEGVRVLFAEDGPDNQRLISFHLRRAGAVVSIVDNGRKLIEALTVDGTAEGDLDPTPAFEVVLTDMQMPELDGYSATRILRGKGCDLPIVALTAHAMSGDIDKCLAAGCDSYAVKPIDSSALVALCVKATAGEIRLKPVVS